MSFVELPKRWPLVQQIANRATSRQFDARLVNAVAEKDPSTGEWQVQKRPGYLQFQTVGASGGGQGLYYWNPAAPTATPALYAIFANGLLSSFYRGTTFVATVPALNASAYYQFAELQSSTPFLLMMNPDISIASGPLVVTATGAAVSQPAIPSTGNKLVGVACLDQTAYVMDDYCNIYGSNINDPTTWVGTNVISANSIAGVGRGLVQILQYLFALKSNSLELFVNNGNPPPGSPLIAAKEGNSNYGCVSGETIQVINNTFLYLSSDKNSQPFLVRVDGVQVTPIMIPSVERLLIGSNFLSSPFSWVCRIGGHRLYCLSSFGAPFSIVYDIDQNLFYEWTSSAGFTFPLLTMAAQGTNIYSQAGTNAIYLLKPSDSQPTDNGSPATVDIYTPSVDFGTMRQKTLHRMYLRTDQSPAYLQVRRSDDDFKTWSTPRNVNLNRADPYIDDEGSFVRRAYNFRHTAARDFRLRSGDLQMGVGTI